MNQLTIFRVKPQLTDPDEILVDRVSLIDFNVRVGGKNFGVLYVDRSTRSLPRWLGYFDQAIDLAGHSLSTATVGAVLLLAHKGFTYAIVFGYGRHLLRQEALEHRFGLRVTLNAVEPTQLRSIDHKRLEAIPRHTREELSRAAGMTQFGLDVERDILRAVTGTPVDANLGRRLSGADALTVVGEIPLADLTDYLERYSQFASQRKYRDSFPWVDNVFEVADTGLVRALDERLVRQLKAGMGDFWLAPPEIVDWITVASFRYSTRKAARDYPDIEFSGYYDEYGSARDLTVERLEQERVYCLKSDDETTKRSWSIYRCLVGELMHSGSQYVLSEGKWYCVDSAFLEALDKFIDQVPQSQIPFPKYAATSEGAYNKVVAKKLKGMACLDQNFVHFPGKGQIEVCDLYSSDKVFVHVKRYSASCALSHLFSQGTVSAQLLVGEPSFRYDFQQKLPHDYRWGDPQQQLKADDFEVCYAIIGRPNRDFSLPFFSKVNLRTAIRTIRGLGLKVSIAHVQALK